MLRDGGSGVSRDVLSHVLSSGAPGADLAIRDKIRDKGCRQHAGLVDPETENAGDILGIVAGILHPVTTVVPRLYT